MDLSLSNPWVQGGIAVVAVILIIVFAILIIVFAIVPLFKKKSSEPVKLQAPGVTVNAVKTGDPKKELYIPPDVCTFLNTMNEYISLQVIITPAVADSNKIKFVSGVKVIWNIDEIEWVSTTTSSKPSFPLTVTLVSKRDLSKNIVCGALNSALPVNNLVIQYALENAPSTFLQWGDIKRFTYDDKIRRAFDSLATGESLPVNLKDLQSTLAMASQAIPYRFTPKSGAVVDDVRVFTSGDNYNIKYPANSATSHTVTMFKLPAGLSGYDDMVAFKNQEGKFLYFNDGSIAFKDNWDDTTFFTIVMQ